MVIIARHMAHYLSKHQQNGFTLIEIAIVLAIIGLITAGILIGADLIRSAGERGQIAQIEQYNRATAAFYIKYHALPGDMDGATAANYGFTTRGSLNGQGDGNNVLEGEVLSTSYNPGLVEEWGENAMFWVDLTYANGMNLGYIDGNYNMATSTQAASCNCQVNIVGPYNPSGGISATRYLDNYLPRGKIGRGSHVYTWSGGTASLGSIATDQENYYGLLNISQLSASAAGQIVGGTSALTVSEAYDIDRKIDDGIANTGNVLALYVNGNTSIWSANANLDTASTCFNSNTGAYSMSISNGAQMNCSVSFHFQ